MEPYNSPYDYGWRASKVVTTTSYNAVVQLEYSDGKVATVPALPIYLDNKDIEHITKLGGTFNDHKLFIKIPAAEAKLVTAGASSVQKCVYNAADSFMEHILGRKMSFDDEAWFSGHPMVQSAGVPTYYIPTVVAGLVYPYDIMIDHIWVRKNTSLAQELMKWMDILGVNPMARQDFSTSNEEFFSMFPEDVRKELAEQYRFEFVDSLPKRPLIIGYGIVPSSSTAVASAALSSTDTMGHAEYCPPRKRPGNNWHIAVSLAYSSQVQYELPEEMRDYEPVYRVDLRQSHINGEPIIPPIAVPAYSRYTPPAPVVPGKGVVANKNTQKKQPLSVWPVNPDPAEETCLELSFEESIPEKAVPEEKDTSVTEKDIVETAVVDLSSPGENVFLVVGWVRDTVEDTVINTDLQQRLFEFGGACRHAVYGDTLLEGLKREDFDALERLDAIEILPLSFILPGDIEKFGELTPIEQLDTITALLRERMKKAKLDKDAIEFIDAMLHFACDFINRAKKEGVEVTAIVLDDMTTLYEPNFFPSWFRIVRNV